MDVAIEVDDLDADGILVQAFKLAPAAFAGMISRFIFRHHCDNPGRLFVCHEVVDADPVIGLLPLEDIIGTGQIAAGMMQDQDLDRAPTGFRSQ